MNLKDTSIQIAGVFRCCFEGICDGIKDNDEVIIGQTTECKHCKQKFILTKDRTWIPITKTL